MEWTPSEIRRRRIDHGLTQSELAQALQVSTSVVNKWENGQREPKGSSIRGLERTLGDRPEPPGTEDLTTRSDVELVALLHAVTAEMTRRLARADHPAPELPSQSLRFPRVVDLPEEHRRRQNGPDDT